MQPVLTVAGHSALALAVAALLIAGIVCGSDAGADSKTSSDKPAAAKAAVDANGAITVVATDNAFAPKEFTARAGQKATVTLDNKGAAIHNLVLKDQKGPDGQEIQTPLLPGGQTGGVELTLPAGSYDYYCSVHPVEMRGKLTVE